MKKIKLRFKDKHFKDEVDYKKALKGNPLSCLTTMYDREIIGERYFPEALQKCEDYVFWLNILKDGYTAYGNPNVLATYNILENSKSRKKLKLIILPQMILR